MYGLTHKRIGVIIFLIVTLIGLITMVLKIYKKLNIRFLLISNSWAFMTLLLILSFVNFDKIIAINNLKRTDCDMDYIKSLSVRVLPIVKKHHPEFNEEDMFQYKYYKQQQNRYTWLSWNLADHKLNGYINSKLLTSE
jgi:hypothetical protein